jgi:hypothetical protein
VVPLVLCDITPYIHRVPRFRSIICGLHMLNLTLCITGHRNTHTQHAMYQGRPKTFNETGLCTQTSYFKAFRNLSAAVFQSCLAWALEYSSLPSLMFELQYISAPDRIGRHLDRRGHSCTYFSSYTEKPSMIFVALSRLVFAPIAFGPAAVPDCSYNLVSSTSFQ